VFSTSVTWSSYWVLLVGSTAAFLASPPIGSPLGFAALRLGSASAPLRSASAGLLLAESLEKRLYSQYEYEERCNETTPYFAPYLESCPLDRVRSRFYTFVRTLPYIIHSYTCESYRPFRTLYRFPTLQECNLLSVA
jgi:hypothetical protein